MVFAALTVFVVSHDVGEPVADETITEEVTVLMVVISWILTLALLVLYRAVLG